MELSEKVKFLRHVNRSSGDLDMKFSRDLSETEQTDLEFLVLDRFNELRELPAAIHAGWFGGKATRRNFRFKTGWDSNNRFETIGCEVARLLYDTGGMDSLIHFLIDVEFIAPLNEVWIFVESSLDWLFEWVFNYSGEFGHRTEPTYIAFRWNPNKDERTKIEALLKFDNNDEDEPADEGFWTSDNRFMLGILEDIWAEVLLSQLNEVNDIVEIAFVGIGAIVRF